MQVPLSQPDLTASFESRDLLCACIASMAICKTQDQNEQSQSLRKHKVQIEICRGWKVLSLTHEQLQTGPGDRVAREDCNNALAFMSNFRETVKVRSSLDPDIEISGWKMLR